MKALRGSALLLFASASEGIAAFAVGVLVAREGGQPALGRLATATALLLVAVTATEMGQNVVLTRRTASNHAGARRGFGGSLVSKAAVALALVPAVAVLWPSDEPRWGIPAAAALMLLSSWTISATAVLRGRERFGRVAAAAVSSAAVSIGGVLLLRPVGLSAILGILAAAQAFKALVAFVSLPAGAAPERPRVGDVRGLIEETLPFAAVVCLGVLYLKADVVLLSAFAGATEAGRYAAAARVTEALKLLPSSLGSAVFPALAAGRGGDLRRALLLAGGFGLAVVLLPREVAEAALVVVFGPSFASSGEVFSILAVTFALGSVNTLLVLGLYARGDERRAVGALAAAVVVNLAVNLWLIPREGAAGAARASALSEAVLLGLYAWALRPSRREGRRPFRLRGALTPSEEAGA